MGVRGSASTNSIRRGYLYGAISALTWSCSSRASTAAPDVERGHVVMAYVVASEPVEAQVLQDHVKASIAPYKYPRRIEFVDALPRTPTGKVQRNVLRERG